MRARIVRALGTALLAGAAPVQAAPISGIGRAIDGDSLMVGDTEVRLYGIDAPEAGQTCQRAGETWNCGIASANQLANLVNGRAVYCEGMGTDRYRRTLARCVAGPTDLNRVMVGIGYAVAFRRYSTDYVSAEDSARANRRGIWSGTFQMPADFRHEGVATMRSAPPLRQERPVSTIPPTSSRGPCTIKGNRNRKGEWIYHVPGMPYYAQTRAEEMFCSEADARAAGYRRAIVR